MTDAMREQLKKAVFLILELNKHPEFMKELTDRGYKINWNEVGKIEEFLNAQTIE